MADRLVFRMGGKFFSIDTSVVDGVMEAEKVFFLPGQGGAVEGIISMRGEPVAVVDIGRVLDAGDGDGKDAPRKIIVVREREKVVGLDIGVNEVSFLWERDGDKPGAGVDKAVDLSAVEPVDWAGLYEEAKRVLSNVG